MIENINISKTQQKNVQINIDKILVYISMLLLCLNYLLYNFFGFEKIKNYIRIVAILFIVLSIISKRELSLFNCILLIAIAFVVIGNGVDSLNIAACLLLGISIDLNKKTFNFLHIVSLILLIMVSVFLLSGVVEEKQYTDTQDRIRNTLGFSNVNSASLFFASYIICFLMSRDKIKVYHIIYVLIISLILYTKTNSRTALGAIIIFVSVYIFSLLRFKSILKILFVFVEILLFLSPLFWTLPLSNDIDKLLSFRITFFKNYIESNGIINFLFGGTHVADVDNFFLILLFNVGFFGYFLLCCLIIKTTRNLIFANKNKELALIITILTVGLVESTGVRVELGMTMLFWIIIVSNFSLKKLFIKEQKVLNL